MFIRLMVSVICTVTILTGLSAQPDSADKQVDSLIRVRKITDHSRIISLGSDAVTAITTSKGIVVIDAGLSASLTAKYRKIIEHEFKRNDFAYLINTHGHRDHTWGNIAFDDAVIIGQENCIAEMADQWRDPEKVKAGLLRLVNEYDIELKSLPRGTEDRNDAYCQKARFQYASDDAANNRITRNPDITFRDTMNLTMGDVKFNLVWFGKAHSNSDILVLVPEEKILMTGDLFFKYGRPSIPDSSRSDVARWLTVMDWIASRNADIKTIIGGHGKVMTKEDLVLFDKFVRKCAGLKNPE
jgi:cyclase